jgi:hypothetical protein
MTLAEQALRRAQIATAAESGVGMLELQRTFEASNTFIYGVCDSFGIRVSSDGDVSKQGCPKRHPFEVLAKLKNGLPDAEVAKQCSLSRQRVHQIKAKARKLKLL